MILSPQQVLSLKTPNQTLRVLQGTLWLTRTADPQDYLLGPGTRQTLPGTGWVLQALDTAEIRLTAGHEIPTPDIAPLAQRLA